MRLSPAALGAPAFSSPVNYVRTGTGEQDNVRGGDFTGELASGGEVSYIGDGKCPHGVFVRRQAHGAGVAISATRKKRASDAEAIHSLLICRQHVFCVCVRPSVITPEKEIDPDRN